MMHWLNEIHLTVECSGGQPQEVLAAAYDTAVTLAAHPRLIEATIKQDEFIGNTYTIEAVFELQPAQEETS